MQLLPQKKPALKEGAKIIQARYDSMKDWRMDPAGYFLIRINPETKELEVGLCKRQNVVEVLVKGRNAEEIYNTVIREGLTKDLTHAAYLGNELQKAEIARALNIPYVQDDPLDPAMLQRSRLLKKGSSS